MNPYLNRAEVMLVEALRSGRYRQGKGALRRRDGTFGCLGVACDAIGGAERWEEDDTQSATRCFVYLNPATSEVTRSEGSLTADIQAELGWSSAFGMLEFRDPDVMNIHLDHLNDSTFTFSQIADIIEAGLVKRAEVQQ